MSMMLATEYLLLNRIINKHMKKNIILSLVLVVIVVGVGMWYVSNNIKQNSSFSLVAQADYICNNNKTIKVDFYKGEEKTVQPGEMPIPNGKVEIILSDGRSLELFQTISADGGRYANSDESFIFWDKGDNALVLENNEEKDYIGCVSLIQSNYKNGIYIIDGKSIQLQDGHSELEIPNSTSKLVTQYFGNEARGDFNGDEFSDVSFLLTQNSGGSGTFFYVVVALGGKNGYQGTNAILLGDRIAPQTSNWMNGEIIVNYAERKPDEPMTARPSMGVSKFLKITDSQLVEIEK